MKKSIIFLSALFITSAFAGQPVKASDHGLYVGVTGGIAYDKLGDKNLAPAYGLKLKKDGSVNMAGRVFMGYDFNKNFGIEAGFLATDNREVKLLVFNKDLLHKFTVGQNILDVTPRINVPVDKFNFYARAGVAYIDAFNDGKDVNKFNLTYGLGVDYKLTNSLSTGISWSHYNGGSNKPIDIIYQTYEPSSDFYGMSISYKISV